MSLKFENGFLIYIKKSWKQGKLYCCIAVKVEKLRIFSQEHKLFLTSLKQTNKKTYVIVMAM